jgi:hypothetical protein
MMRVTAAGAPVLSAPHAQAGVQQINTSAARSNKFNLHALNRHISQVSGNAMLARAPDRRRRNSTMTAGRRTSPARRRHAPLLMWKPSNNRE